MKYTIVSSKYLAAWDTLSVKWVIVLHEIADLKGIPHEEFDKAFTAWFQTMPYSFIKAVGICKYRIARGLPLPWETQDQKQEELTNGT